MLKLQTIQNSFSEFCQEWHYSIESYDERLSTLLLKHKKYSDYKDSYIYVDFVNRIIRSYSTLELYPDNLFSDALVYEELRDLFLVLSFIFKKLDMEFYV